MRSPHGDRPQESQDFRRVTSVCKAVRMACGRAGVNGKKGRLVGGGGGGGQQQDQVTETERNTVSPGRPEEEPAVRKSARGSGK